jgi:hypothetical protein
VRRAVTLVVVVAVVVAVLAVADVLVRRTVERDIASHIEARVPGTSAQVQITSFPFVGRIATSGSVPTLDAEITGLKVGPFPVDTVDIAVHDLKVSRRDLLQGKVVLQSVRTATVTGVITQQSVDTGSGLPVTLGNGTVGLGGIQVPARISVRSDDLTVSVAPLPTLTVPLLPAALLPCTATATISAGRITLACTTSTIPPALVDAVAASR